MICLKGRQPQLARLCAVRTRDEQPRRDASPALPIWNDEMEREWDGIRRRRTTDKAAPSSRSAVVPHSIFCKISIKNPKGPSMPYYTSSRPRSNPLRPSSRASIVLIMRKRSLRCGRSLT